MLPFGLCSAPKLFTAVTDALEWYLTQRGIRQVFHYLDDFIVVAPRASPECARALDTLNESRVRLGIPIAEHKRDMVHMPDILGNQDQHEHTPTQAAN